MECAVAVAKIKLGPVTAEPAGETLTRMAILIWGLATVGKSTFAATAPGKKLWLSFGDEEHRSVAHRKDIVVAKLYGLSLDELFKHAQSDNPFGLDEVLATHTDIETVVGDSITALTFRALQKSVKEGTGAGKGFTPTMLMPGQSAYGGRNAIVLECITGLLKVTAKHNVHCILTAHEADATTKKDDRGNDIIDYVGMMLGGQLVNNMSYRLSEIWHMSQNAHGAEERRLAIRPTRLRRPMKTRMFSSIGEKDFILNYDADKPDNAKGQMTIAGWYDEYVDGGYQKLPVPEVRKAGKART
jgi:AAA domain